MREFNVGDHVTFWNGEDIHARVKAVAVPVTRDGRIWYELTGTDRKKPLITKCTGHSIKESALFRREVE